MNEDADTDSELTGKPEKFPSYLANQSEIFAFSYGEILEIARKFRSSNDIVFVIESLMQEEKIDNLNEDQLYDLAQLLSDEIQVIRFSIDTRNNILPL